MKPSYVSIRQLEGRSLKRIKLQENKVKGSYRLFYVLVCYNQIRPSFCCEFPKLEPGILERDSLLEALISARPFLSELLSDHIPLPLSAKVGLDAQLFETKYRKYVRKEGIFSNISEARDWLTRQYKKEKKLLEKTRKDDDPEDIPVPLRTHQIEVAAFYVPVDLAPLPAREPATDEEEDEEMMLRRAELYQELPADPMLTHVKKTKGLKIFEVSYKKRTDSGWAAFPTRKEASLCSCTAAPLLGMKLN